MAHHLRAALTLVKSQMQSRLPVDVDELARQVGHQWRQRPLPPSLTIWFFALQILNGNCAINALRHIGGLPTQASSYCAARMSLPLELFTRLFDAVSRMAASALGAGSGNDATTLLNGRRVLLADATSFSVPDTIQLRDHFGYPAGQREGCGFPVGKLLGVIDALSGTVISALCCPLFSHEAREMLALHPLLKRFDILVADRAFCSYTQIALLLRHGVDAVMRLHQRRPVQWAKDHIETWTRPPQRPAWMSQALWLSLPEQFSIRIVRCVVPRRGCRTRVIYIATTLLDPIAYPAQSIMRLYGHRWSIETCFNSLKTHAKMNALKSKTVQGVIKELIMYLIVWNLVRMTMQKYAAAAGVSVWRVSFIDTMRWLCALLQPQRPATMQLLINPDRPGRWEPRKLKRRMKEYDLLKEPRQNLKAKHSAHCG
jgi:Transposase DDE domain